MKNWFDDIGCAAGLVQGHAIRLFIGGHDSAGAGSAAVDDEEPNTQDIADDDLLLDDEDFDGRPRGTRSDRQARAYDELKSDRDRLKTEAEKRDREFQALQDRLVKLEQTRETREEVNARTNMVKERAKTRAKEIVEEIQKIPADDPERSAKIYERLFETVYSDQEETAQEISRRTSSEVYHDTQTQEQQRAEARKQTLALLEEEGLGEETFDLVEALAIRQGRVDPGWFKRTPAENQIPELVKMVKDRMIKTTRNSQEFREDKRRHREPMDGVIGEGSRGNRSRRDADDDRPEGPGSILADLAKLKQSQRRNTQVMLRQAER